MAIICKGYIPKIIVHDEFLHTKPSRTHYGIGIDLIINVDKVNFLQSIVENAILEIISILSFCEACFIGRPEFVLKYRIPDQGTNLEDFKSHILNKDILPKETTTRIANPNRIKKFFSMIDSITDLERKKSITNSLHWFWKALGDNDVRDRFLHLWIAVEYLEKELKKEFNIPTSELHYPICRYCHNEFRSCPECEKDFGYKANTGFAGFKFLEKKVASRKGLFNKLHKLRSKIVHAGRLVLPKEASEEAIMDSYNLLVKAIFVLCGVDHLESKIMPNFLRGESLPPILVFEGQIEVTKIPDLDEVHLQPIGEGSYSFNAEIDEITDDLLPNWGIQHDFLGVFKKGFMKKSILLDQSHNIKDVWDKTENDK
jgi:hypothetical protein